MENDLPAHCLKVRRVYFCEQEQSSVVAVEERSGGMGGCGRRAGGEQEGVDLLGRVPMDEGMQVALLSLLIHQGPALCTTILHLFIIFL